MTEHARRWKHTAHNASIGIHNELGGGNLFSSTGECFKYVSPHRSADSIAVACSLSIDANVNYFENLGFDEAVCPAK